MSATGFNNAKNFMKKLIVIRHIKIVNCFCVSAKYNLNSTEGLEDNDIETSLLAFQKKEMKITYFVLFGSGSSCSPIW